jgi:hypothetical protein
VGYAWSSNIGWIKFHDFENHNPRRFPTDGGTVARSAYVEGTDLANMRLVGWARACSATVGGECGSSDTNANSGGWDGWISLSGTTHAVRANFTGGEFLTDSYAWGSDVVGWVDMFTHADFAESPTSLEGTGCFIDAGASSCTARLTWNIPSSYSNPNIRKITAPASQVSTDATRTNYQVTVGEGDTTFHARSGSQLLTSAIVNASCRNSTWNDSTKVCETTVAPGLTPVITLTVTPPVVRSGGKVTVDWNITNFTVGECALIGPGITGPITTADDDILTGPITSQSKVKITCTGAYGTVMKEATIEVIPLSQEV